jgi:3-hydroxyisobutyrate dehydrogenase-like beta-hydroxyacid dehydrogenase
MGSAMAGNLVKAGFEVIGTDLLPEARAALTKAGGKAVASTAEVGKACRQILISIASIPALHVICKELADNCAKGTIILETGTLPLADKQKARAVLAERGIILLDCTLSGTGAQAKNRDLAVYASGEKDAIEKLGPVIDGFARVCYNLGEFGNGTKMKFVANLLVAIHNVAAAEAMLLGVRSGLDPVDMVKVIGDGAGSSRMFQMRAPLMADRTWDQVITMKNTVWQKDMHLIDEALHETGVPAPLFSTCIPIYIAAVNGGHAGHDTAAVYEILERMSLDPAAKK